MTKIGGPREGSRPFEADKLPSKRELERPEKPAPESVKRPREEEVTPSKGSGKENRAENATESSGLLSRIKKLIGVETAPRPSLDADMTARMPSAPNHEPGTLTDEERMAKLRSLSPPRANPFEEDLQKRMEKLRGGVQLLTESQLAEKLRELKGTKDPKIEKTLQAMNKQRVDAKSSSRKEFLEQNLQFFERATSAVKQIETLSKGNREDKFSAADYASVLRDRIGLELKYLGVAKTQVSQRKDLSENEQKQIMSELDAQRSALEKMRGKLLEIRFLVAGDVQKRRV